MGFPTIVATCTEALLLLLVCAVMMQQKSAELKQRRLNNPDFKPSIGDWSAFVIMMLWLGFQFWKVWCLIRTLL